MPPLCLPHVSANFQLSRPGSLMVTHFSDQHFDSLESQENQHKDLYLSSSICAKMNHVWGTQILYPARLCVF